VVGGAAAAWSVLMGVDPDKHVGFTGHVSPSGLMGGNCTLLALRDPHAARGAEMYRIISPLTAVATLPPSATAHVEIVMVQDLGGLFAAAALPPPDPTPSLTAPSLIGEDGAITVEFEKAREFFEATPPGRQPPPDLATYTIGQCKALTRGAACRDHGVPVNQGTE
jgi:hypothetical protein